MKYLLFWFMYMTAVAYTPQVIEWSMSTHVSWLVATCIYLGAAGVFGVAAFGMWTYLHIKHVL